MEESETGILETEKMEWEKLDTRKHEKPEKPEKPEKLETEKWKLKNRKLKKHENKLLEN